MSKIQVQIKAQNHIELNLTSRPSAIDIHIDPQTLKTSTNYKPIVVDFTPEQFKALYDSLYSLAKLTWPTLQLKEANSIGSDYNEYYDRKLDNNGYLSLKDLQIVFSIPVYDNAKCYQFNKRKIESFLYDFKKKLC